MLRRSRHPSALHVFEMMNLHEIQQNHPWRLQEGLLGTAGSIVTELAFFEVGQEIVE